MEDKDAASHAKPSVGGYTTQSFNLGNLGLHIIAPDDVAKYYGDPINPEARSFEGVRLRVNEDFEWLRTRAEQGDRQAIVVLAELGCNVAMTLAELNDKRPDLVKSVAANRYKWPITISPMPADLSNAKRLLKKLKIGDNLRFRFDTCFHNKKIIDARVVVYQALLIFENIRRGSQAAENYELLSERLKKISGQDSVIESSPAYKAILAQTSKNQRIREDAMRQTQQLLLGLIGFLKIPASSLLGAYPFLIAVTDESLSLLDFSRSTKNEWNQIIVSLLVTLVGGEFGKEPRGNRLERNNILRKWGIPAGDVELRKIFKTNDLKIIKAKRTQESDNEVVNGAIRRQILGKVKSAVIAFANAVAASNQ